MDKIIKILAVIGLIAIMLSLCSFGVYKRENEKNELIQLCEYKLNGHYYVVATKRTYDSGVGIIHSPNCKCGKK